MTFILATLAMLGLIAVGIPIGFALGIAGVASLAMLIPMDMIYVLMGKVVHGTTANYLLLAIPMFVLMSEFLAAGGVAEDMLYRCNRLLRKVRGGMAMACVLAGAIHAATTGSSAASAASLARASFPAMSRAGYAASFSTGTIAIAGTLATLIPPSIAFILYGFMTETSVGKLFVAGMIPGIMTAIGYIITIYIVLKFKPELGPDFAKERELSEMKSTGPVWPMLALLVIIVGGLYGGVATPTEIAAVGAFGALVISLILRRMNWDHFVESVGGTLRITTMILTIIIGAHVLGYYVSFSRITTTSLDWIIAQGLSPTVVMLSLVLLYLILGMFMDQGAIIILTAPITAPLVVGLGYDPVWWGVIMIKTAEIGLVSPPLGIVTFVVSSQTRTELRDCFRGVMPFILTELVLLGLLIAFPVISLGLIN